MRIVRSIATSTATFLVGEVVGDAVDASLMLFTTNAEATMREASHVTAVVSACVIDITML